MAQDTLLELRGKKVRAFIEASLLHRGYPPSVREIGKHLKFHSASGVYELLNQLEAAGYIERDAGVPRGIRVGRG